MSLNLSQIFHELKDHQEHYFSEEQLASMPYFKQLQTLLPQKDFSVQIKKSKRLFRLLHIKKGTVIYLSSTQSNCGYFLCHGCVKLLIKKNNRQKLQNYPKHVLHQAEQRVKFLNEQYSIPLNKCEILMNQFYQEKVLFKYLEYQLIYGQGYFGINDLTKSSNRPFTAIATQDTVLLEIDKTNFDSTLKQLQMKKQQVILATLLQNFNSSINMNSASSFPSISQQLGVKLSQAFNYFVLRNFEKDQRIFKENSLAKYVYFILKGQVELSKSFPLQVPKKMVKDENKPQVGKQVDVKVTRLSQKCYLGQVQHLLHSRLREFTATAIKSNTIVLQIQPHLFIKIMGQFTTVQRDLTISAKQKLSIASENFLKQKTKITKLFLQQFQNIQNKKKQKILSNLLNDDSPHQNNLLSQATSNMFQIFSKQGMLFRDTYERLQGFQEYEQNQANNKRAAIRKYKVQTSYVKGNSNDKNLANQFPKYPSINLDDDFESFTTKERLFNSPKKNLNIFELIGSATTTPQLQINNRISQTSKQGKLRQSRTNSTIKKFNRLQKDETVFKRVLIKNGRYQQDKSTYKSNIVKPIVHPKFDSIVKECMGRKNQVIRKAIGEKRTDLVKDNYENVVGQLKNKSLSVSKFSSYNYSTACKGTQQFRKKLDMFARNNRKSDHQSAIRNIVALQQGNLQACLGVNQPPKSSYLKNRSEMLQQPNQNHSKILTKATITTSVHLGFGQRTFSQDRLMNEGKKITTNSFIGKRNTPQKLILLNHMMKPITYSSIHY